MMDLLTPIDTTNILVDLFHHNVFMTKHLTVNIIFSFSEIELLRSSVVLGILCYTDNAPMEQKNFNVNI